MEKSLGETTVLWLQRLCLFRVLTNPGPSRQRLPGSRAVLDKPHPQSQGWLPDPPEDGHDGLHPYEDKHIPLCPYIFHSQHAAVF